MKLKTNVKVGATNGTMHVGSGSTLTMARGLKVKTGVKAGQGAAVVPGPIIGPPG